MSYTLLDLVGQVSGELGLVQPSIVIGSAENQTIQLLALMQRLGKDLIREFEWRDLVKQYVWQTIPANTYTGTLHPLDLNTSPSFCQIITALSSTAGIQVGDVVSGTGIAPFTQVTAISNPNVTIDMPSTVSSTTTGVSITFAHQDYALPSDFDRMIRDSNWDRTNHWTNMGPQSSQQWQTVQGGLISTGPRERYRLYGNKMRIFPALTTTYNMAYEYVSNAWVYATGGSLPTKSLLSVDSDTMIFPDDLLCAGLKYYFLKAKRLDYGVELAEYSDILATVKAQDSPNSVKQLSNRQQQLLINVGSIPEGNWPTS